MRIGSTVVYYYIRCIREWSILCTRVQSNHIDVVMILLQFRMVALLHKEVSIDPIQVYIWRLPPAASLALGFRGKVESFPPALCDMTAGYGLTVFGLISKLLKCSNASDPSHLCPTRGSLTLEG